MGGKDECPDKNHAESHRDPGEFGTPVPHSTLLVPKQEERTVPHQKKSTYRPDQAQDEGHDGNGQQAGRPIRSNWRQGGQHDGENQQDYRNQCEWGKRNKEGEEWTYYHPGTERLCLPKRSCTILGATNLSCIYWCFLL